MKNFVIKNSRGEFVRNLQETTPNHAKCSYTSESERAQVFEKYGCACAACRKLGYAHDLRIYHREGSGTDAKDVLIDHRE